MLDVYCTELFIVLFDPQKSGGASALPPDL